MISGVNLHKVVRSAVNFLHPDVRATLYRSTGQVVIEGGQPKSTYAEGAAIIAQMQSEGPTTLNHIDRVGQEEVYRKFYLSSSSDMQTRVAGIIRPLTRGGDMFQIDPSESWFAGTWWLVEATSEDFTRSGWANVRAVMQVNAPDFSHSAWATV